MKQKTHRVQLAFKGLSHQEKEMKETQRPLLAPDTFFHVATNHTYWFSKPVWLM